MQWSCAVGPFRRSATARSGPVRAKYSARWNASKSGTPYSASRSAGDSTVNRLLAPARVGCSVLTGLVPAGVGATFPLRALYGQVSDADVRLCWLCGTGTPPRQTPFSGKWADDAAAQAAQRRPAQPRAPDAGRNRPLNRRGAAARTPRPARRHHDPAGLPARVARFRTGRLAA